MGTRIVRGNTSNFINLSNFSYPSRTPLYYQSSYCGDLIHTVGFHRSTSWNYKSRYPAEINSYFSLHWPFSGEIQHILVVLTWKISHQLFFPATILNTVRETWTARGLIGKNKAITAERSVDIQWPVADQKLLLR